MAKTLSKSRIAIVVFPKRFADSVRCIRQCDGKTLRRQVTHFRIARKAQHSQPNKAGFDFVKITNAFRKKVWRNGFLEGICNFKFSFNNSRSSRGATGSAQSSRSFGKSVRGIRHPPFNGQPMWSDGSGLFLTFYFVVWTP